MSVSCVCDRDFDHDIDWLQLIAQDCVVFVRERPEQLASVPEGFYEVHKKDRYDGKKQAVFRKSFIHEGRRICSDHVFMKVAILHSFMELCISSCLYPSISVILVSFICSFNLFRCFHFKFQFQLFVYILYIYFSLAFYFFYFSQLSAYMQI